MSWTTDMALDLGVLGEHEVEVTYFGRRGSAGGFDEPPTDDDFYIEAIKARGVDLLPFVADDPFLLKQITADVLDRLAGY